MASPTLSGSSAASPGSSSSSGSSSPAAPGMAAPRPRFRPADSGREDEARPAPPVAAAAIFVKGTMGGEGRGGSALLVIRVGRDVTLGVTSRVGVTALGSGDVMG